LLIFCIFQAIAGSKVQLGAQNAYYEDKGAFTGAVSVGQIKSCGCKYCLVGHSERRKVFGESDNEFNQIVKKVHASGLTPILCIGETKEEYELGLNEQICTIQLARDLQGLSPDLVKKTVIAYEPVWAIGTGLTASPEIAQSVHKAIRNWLRKTYGDDVADAVIIQYGGSVTADNVDALMKQPDIDGALVGGASLTASSFSRIVKFQ
jgi:triosephosphate isomerase (TIM)